VDASGIDPDSLSGCGKKGLGQSVLAGGAESGAVGAHPGPIDPDLALLIDARPRLPESVRRQILGMVKAGATPGEIVIFREFTPTLQKHLVGRTSKSVTHEFNINARPLP